MERDSRLDNFYLLSLADDQQYFPITLASAPRLSKAKVVQIAMDIFQRDLWWIEAFYIPNRQKGMRLKIKPWASLPKKELSTIEST